MNCNKHGPSDLEGFKGSMASKLRLSSRYFSSVPLLFFLVLFCVELGFDTSLFTDSVYDQKRLIQLMTFALLVIALLMDRRQVIRLHGAWLMLPVITRRALLLIIALGAISCYLAPLPRQAFQEWSLFGLMLIFTLFVCTQLGSFSIQKVVLALLAVGFALYGWRFLAGVYLPGLLNHIDVTGFGIFVGFAHPRFLNQLQSWVLPMLPALPIVFSGQVARRYQVLLWIPGVISWILLFASAGRATLIALGFSSIVVFLLFNRESRLWLKTQLYYFVVGLVLYLLLFYLIPQLSTVDLDMPKVTERLVKDGLMGRDTLWNLALQITASHPIVGLGPQQFANLRFQAIAAHPHSAPLQWLCEWGVISLFAMSGIAVYAFVKWVTFCKCSLRQPNRENSNLLTALTASLVAGAAHSLVSGIIVMPFSQMLMCLFIGWALAVYHATDKSFANTPKFDFHHVLTIGAVLVLQATILYTSYPEILNAAETRDVYLAQHPQETIIKPRFWVQGLIGWR